MTNFVFIILVSKLVFVVLYFVVIAKVGKLVGI